jgi:hypothetical protein
VQAAVKETLLSMCGEYVIVVGVGDATNTDMGASVDSSCAPTKYRFEGMFVVSQTSVPVPDPLTPTEYAYDICSASTIDPLKGIRSTI